MANQPRVDKRISITIQLTPGKDDDLIGYLRSLGKGQRQQEIKAALRDRNNRDKPDINAIAAAIARIESEINNMPGWFDKRLSRLSVVAGENNPSDGPRLSSEDQERLKAKMKKAAW